MRTEQSGPAAVDESTYQMFRSGSARDPPEAARDTFADGGGRQRQSHLTGEIGALGRRKKGGLTDLGANELTGQLRKTQTARLSYDQSFRASAVARLPCVEAASSDRRMAEHN
jgi:hypothetical protein